MENSKIKTNLFYAIVSQLVVLVISITTSLVLPKVLSIEYFGYWQLFLFYISYIGVTHLGVLDGIYLRLGGKFPEEIDKSLFTQQFIVYGLYFAVIGLVVSFLFNQSHWQLFMMVGINIVIGNLFSYIGYVLQATNQIKLFSQANIFEKILFFGSLVIFFALEKNNYLDYIYIYTISRLIALCYLAIKTKHYFTYTKIKIVVLKEIYENLLAGFPLLLANFSSMLVLGFARLMVEKHWGIATFSKISFAISLTNLLLLFVSQVSLVLFPALKRANKSHLNLLFTKLNYLISMCMLFGLLFYPIVFFIVVNWLPKYYDSLYYLALLLPMCLYEGKMQMIHTTYFKALRKERSLLVLNVISALISIVGVMCAIQLNSIDGVIYSVVIAVIFRSFLAYFIIVGALELNVELNEWVSLIVIWLYVFLINQFSMLSAMLLYSFVLAGYMYITRDKLKPIIQRLRRKYE